MSVSEHPSPDPPIPVVSPRDPSLHEQVTALDRHVRQIASQLDAVGRELCHLRHAVGATAAAPLPVSARPALDALDAGERPGFLLRLLGSVELLHGDAPVELNRRGKAEAVLKALALSRGRRVAPGLRAEWVWPDRDAEDARRSLQPTVSAIRRTVQRIDGAVDPIQLRGDAYRLGPSVTTDIDLFDAAWDRALAFERAGADDLALATMVAAAALYRDDIDVDEFEDLRFVIDRERLAGLNLHVLGKIGATYARLERWEECIAWATRLLARDPGCEDAHRMIIRGYLRLGRRSRGLHHYRLCSRIVREHYDADLEPETAALLRELL
jgi:DNA-binding SARP family transcriptional activator